MVAPSLADNLMRLVAEGAGEGYDEADAELRSRAAASYLSLLSKPKLPDILLKVLPLSNSDTPVSTVLVPAHLYKSRAHGFYGFFSLASVPLDVCLSRESMTFASFSSTPAIGTGQQRLPSARPSRAGDE